MQSNYRNYQRQYVLDNINLLFILYGILLICNLLMFIILKYSKEDQQGLSEDEKIAVFNLVACGGTLVISAIGVLISRRWLFLIEFIFPTLITFQVTLNFSLFSDQVIKTNLMSKEKLSRQIWVLLLWLN